MVSARDPRLSKWDVLETIQGPVGPLTVVVTAPSHQSDPGLPARDRSSRYGQSRKEPRWMAVIGHPHPQMGGTLHNKVVQTIARSIRDCGGYAIRFNYRGVEGSPGQFDGGQGEAQDFERVLRWAQAQINPDFILLFGFSFGSYVAALVASSIERGGADDVRCRGLVLVAPPVCRLAFSDLPPSKMPVFVVQGEVDEVVSPEAVYEWVEQCQDPAGEGDRQIQLTRMQGAGHFFHGQLMALKKTMGGIIKEVII